LSDKQLNNQKIKIKEKVTGILGHSAHGMQEAAPPGILPMHTLKKKKNSYTGY
jgi:hypothetical protein